MSFWSSLGTIFGGRRDLNATQNAAMNTVGKPLSRGLSRNEAALRGDWDVVDSMADGGPIEKTGIYQLHKGEYVLPKNDVEMVKKVMATRMKNNRNEWKNQYNNIP